MTTKRTTSEPITSLDSDTPIADGDVGGSDGLDRVEMVANGTANTTEEARRDGAPAPILSQPSVRSQLAEQTSDATGEDAEDAMVAEYMKRLLGRMRGEESPQTDDVTRMSPPAGDAATDNCSAVNSSLEMNSSADDNGATSSTSAPTSSIGVSETAHDRAVRQPRKPRPATLPESSCDWTAMRELANLSARGALDMHSRQRLTKDTFTKLLLAGLSLAAGFSMALNASVVGVYAWVGASVCWTITVVWGAQYYCLYRMSYGLDRRSKKNRSKGGDAKNTETAAAATGSGD